MAAWVRRRDRHNQFITCPYQDAPSPPMTPALFDACANAMHVVTADAQVLRAGRASLFILQRIGWGWVARILAMPPFIWAVEAGYRIVAARRPFFAKFLFTREQDGTEDQTAGSPSC
jgi:predicted DCC family thiol-disulfide oxidoreductase YuxK